MRKLFVGGNWKSNNTFKQTKDIVNNVYNKLQINSSKVEVIAAPVALHIPYVYENIQKSVQISTQNISATGYGAFTGEISPQQAVDFGLHWTIVGHSERRELFGETNEVVAKKTKFALDNGMSTISCIGEKLEHREANQTFDVISQQLASITNLLKPEDWTRVVIAYEPVWAIGTGKVATPDQAQEVHAFIRKFLSEKVSSDISQATRILYGGSVSEKNARDLISQPDLDGFLVGGAALKEGFIEVVNACQQ